MAKTGASPKGGGNISSLYRTGEQADRTAYDMDILNYAYQGGNGNSNLLSNVNDEASFGNTDGFTDGNTNPALDDYEYDLNGNMVKDRNKGIESITYNHLNLPRQIMWENMSSVTYMYNALGQKVSKIVTYPDGSIKPVDYLDASTQLSTGYFQYAGEILQFFPHPEGYVDVLARIVDDKPYTYRYKYVYNYTDHLGNIRMSYTLNPQNNKLEILEENHYFPFGLKHSTYIPADKKMLELIVKQNEEKIKIKIVQETEYQYKYNGKEWQDELGLNFYDYGARNYDPALGRWMNMDPLAELSRRWSPYTYAYNNPLRFIDPDGMKGEDIIYRHINKSTGETTNYVYRNGDFYNLKTNERADYRNKNNTSDHMFRTRNSLNVMANSSDKILSNQIKTLEKSTNRHFIKEGKLAEDYGKVESLNNHTSSKDFDYNGGSYETVMTLDFSETESFPVDSETISDTELVAHEISHAYDADTGTYNREGYKRKDKHKDPNEIRATVNGNRARRIEGRAKRTTYGGKSIESEKLKQMENETNY